MYLTMAFQWIDEFVFVAETKYGEVDISVEKTEAGFAACGGCLQDEHSALYIGTTPIENVPMWFADVVNMMLDNGLLDKLARYK